MKSNFNFSRLSAVYPAASPAISEHRHYLASFQPDG
jgi:hypothetical protein